MNKLRWGATALILFALMISLSVTINQGVNTAYNVTQDNQQEGLSVGEKLNSLIIIDGVSNIAESVAQLKNPINPLNVGDALISAGIGVLKLVGGLVTFPFEIMEIIFDFYPGVIPPIFKVAFYSIIVIIVAFLLISAYLRTDV